MRAREASADSDIMQHSCISLLLVRRGFMFQAAHAGQVEPAAINLTLNTHLRVRSSGSNQRLLAVTHFYFLG